jgi:hypothetical protein
MENVPLSPPSSSPGKPGKPGKPVSFRQNPHPRSFSSDPAPSARPPTEEDRELFGYLFDKNGVPLPGATITTWDDSTDDDLETLIKKATKGLQFETETALKACKLVLEAAKQSVTNPRELAPHREPLLEQIQQIPPEPASPIEYPKDTHSEGSMPAVLARVEAVDKLWESLESFGLSHLEPVPGLTRHRFQEITEDLSARSENLTELLWDLMFCSGPEKE